LKKKSKGDSSRDIGSSSVFSLTGFDGDPSPVSDSAPVISRSADVAALSGSDDFAKSLGSGKADAAGEAWKVGPA